MDTFFVGGATIDRSAQTDLNDDKRGDDADDLDKSGIEESVSSGIVLEGQVEGHVDRVDETGLDKHRNRRVVTLEEGFVNNGLRCACKMPDTPGSETSEDDVQCEGHGEVHPRMLEQGQRGPFK